MTKKSNPRTQRRQRVPRQQGIQVFTSTYPMDKSGPGSITCGAIFLAGTLYVAKIFKDALTLRVTKVVMALSGDRLDVEVHYNRNDNAFGSDIYFMFRLAGEIADYKLEFEALSTMDAIPANLAKVDDPLLSQSRPEGFKHHPNLRSISDIASEITTNDLIAFYSFPSVWANVKKVADEFERRFRKGGSTMPVEAAYALMEAPNLAEMPTSTCLSPFYSVGEPPDVSSDGDV